MWSITWEGEEARGAHRRVRANEEGQGWENARGRAEGAKALRGKGLGSRAEQGRARGRPGRPCGWLWG